MKLETGLRWQQVYSVQGLKGHGKLKVSGQLVIWIPLARVLRWPVVWWQSTCLSCGHSAKQKQAASACPSL